MSWGEVFKVNNKIKKPINKLLFEKKYFPIRVITTTGTYTPEKTGLYRVICVGAGGDGFYRTYNNNFTNCGGGGGGVAIKDMTLTSTTSYNATISTTASFGSTLTATAGLKAVNTESAGYTQYPIGGTASGGDYNFTGETGEYDTINKANNNSRGGSVGVVIGELMSYRYSLRRSGLVAYGDSLLGYGGGGTSSTLYENSSSTNFTEVGLPAAIIIIPLELEA